MTSYPTTTEEYLHTAANEIRSRGKHVVGDIIEIGRLLTECKARLSHGQWPPWLEREFAWEETTARRFMSVYWLNGKSGKLQDLSFDVSALYKLAARSTPDTVREEVLERARQGEHVSLKIVAEAVKPQTVAMPVYSSPGPRPPTPLRCHSITADEEPTVSPRVVTGADLRISLLQSITRDLRHLIGRLRGSSSPPKVADLLKQAEHELETTIAEMEAKREAHKH
jgi:hypothetical protein